MVRNTFCFQDRHRNPNQTSFEAARFIAVHPTEGWSKTSSTQPKECLGVEYVEVWVCVVVVVVVLLVCFLTSLQRHMFNTDALKRSPILQRDSPGFAVKLFSEIGDSDWSVPSQLLLKQTRMKPGLLLHRGSGPERPHRTSALLSCTEPPHRTSALLSCTEQSTTSQLQRAPKHVATTHNLICTVIVHITEQHATAATCTGKSTLPQHI
jgi:hypothetical protein